MGGPAPDSALEGLTSSAWKEIAEITGRTADELYSPLCFIENDVTDSQVHPWTDGTLVPIAAVQGGIAQPCNQSVSAQAVLVERRWHGVYQLWQ